MRAQKFNRRVRFFNKANRGKCANKHGVFIETILEGDKVCGDKDDVCPVEARKYLFEEVWFHVRSDGEEEEKEEDLTNSANVTSCGSVTASVSVEEADNPELDSDNHVTNKTQEEVVGTLGVTSALPQNDPPTLGSGFYLVDSMGRTTTTTTNTVLFSFPQVDVAEYYDRTMDVCMKGREVS